MRTGRSVASVSFTQQRPPVRTGISLTDTSVAAKRHARPQVKVFAEQHRVARSCAERKKWKVFGIAAEVPDNHSYTIVSQEQVMMETPQESKEADEGPSNVSDRCARSRCRRRRANHTGRSVAPRVRARA
jgi:Eukaryotic translation initiation factor 3 subunit G